MKIKLTCQYCGKETEKVQGDEIYKNRDDLKDKSFFICRDCDAYVGCHQNGEPLGTVANEHLRKQRSLTHQIFDEIWKSRYMTRSDAYKFLRENLKIKKDECHIAMFDEELCIKVREVSIDFFKKCKGE